MHVSHWLWLGGAMLAAMVFGALALKFKQPRVLGALVAGLIISLAAGQTEVVQQIRSGKAELIIGLAEFGAMLLLFKAGLEANIKSIIDDARTGWKVAVLGVIIPMVGGFVYVYYAVGTSWPVALFQGGVFAATSVGITAAVLTELGMLNSHFGRIIISAAVIDDVLGLLALTICGALNQGNDVPALVLGLKIGGAVLFVLVIPILGHYLTPRIVKSLARLDLESRETVVLAFMILYGVGAQVAGLAAIVGAYFAGVALDEAFFEKRAHDSSKPIEHFVSSMVTALGPVFFVYAATIVDPAVFSDSQTLGLGLIFSLIAILGKLACGLVVPAGSRLIVGVGMAPRGEVGIVFATLGLQNGILNNQLFGASMIMVLLTTIITPPALGWAIRKSMPPENRSNLDSDRPGAALKAH